MLPRTFILAALFLLLSIRFSSEADTCTLTILQRYNQFDTLFSGQNHTYQFYLTFDDVHTTMSYIRFVFPSYTESSGPLTHDDATTDCVGCSANVGQYETGIDGSGFAYIDWTNPSINLLIYSFTANYIQNPSSPVSITPTCDLYDVTDALISSLTSTTYDYQINTDDEMLLELSTYENGSPSTLTFRWPFLQVYISENALFRVEIPPQTYNYVSYGLDVESSIGGVTISMTYLEVGNALETALTFALTQSMEQDSDVFEMQLTNSVFGDAGELKINIAGYLNPPSFKPLENFFVKFTDQNGNIQEQLSGTLTTSVAATLGSNTAFSITQNPEVGADNTVYQFTIDPTNPIPKASVVAIEGFDFVEFASLASLVITCVSNCQSTSAVILETNGIFYIEGLWSEPSSSAIAAGTLVVFEITGFTNPQDDSQHFFNLHTLDTGYYGIDSMVDTLYLQSTRTGTGGVITASGIQIKNSWHSFWFMFRLPVTFQFGIVVQTQVMTTDKLEITLSGALVVSKDAECEITGLAATATCFASTSLNMITISTFVAASTNVFTTFFFTVNRIRKVTMNAFTTATFNFELKDASDNLVDSGTQVYPYT